MRVDTSATQSPPPSTHSHAHVPKKHARTGPQCVPELPGQSAQSSTQARTACARTACASTPVPRKAPHPAHTATHMCQKTRTNPLAQGLAQCARRCAVSTVHTGTMRGSYMGAGILIGDADTRPLASAKNIQETNTRARAHRRCLCAYRRQSNVGEARQCCLVYVKMTVCTVGCDRNRMANLSKASNVVQEKYILYDVTGLTQKWHSIPVATNCRAQ